MPDFRYPGGYAGEIWKNFNFLQFTKKQPEI